MKEKSTKSKTDHYTSMIAENPPYHYDDYEPLNLSEITPEMVTERDLIKKELNMQLWRCVVNDQVVYLYEGIEYDHNSGIPIEHGNPKDGTFFNNIETHITFDRRATAHEIGDYLGIPSPPTFQGDTYFISQSGPSNTMGEQLQEMESSLKSNDQYQQFIENGIDQFITDLGKLLVLHDHNLNPDNTLLTHNFEYSFVDLAHTNESEVIFGGLRTCMRTLRALELPQELIFLTMRRAKEMADQIMAFEYTELNEIEQMLYDSIKDNHWVFTMSPSNEFENIEQTNVRFSNCGTWDDIGELITEQ